MILKRRTFIPGSKWLYFKIYTGIITADKILIRIIYNIIRTLNKNNLIEKWFFIRYSDPNFHLRIRVLFKNEQDIGSIIGIFYKYLNNSVNYSLVWKVQIDTYNRELERYSINMIEESESIFHMDSICSLSIIKALSKIDNEDYRWMITLNLIDKLLTDFSFNIFEKQNIMDQLSNNFKIEFGFNEFNSKQLNLKYRENKSTIENVLDNKEKRTDFVKLNTYVKKRSKMLIPIVNLIGQKTKDRNSINTLIISYIHMTINRIFPFKNRLFELVLYDFLYRYYTSKIAKFKYNDKTKTFY